MSNTAGYVQAIRDLDAMEQEVKDGFELNFISDNMSRVINYGDKTRFSDKQKAVIRKMVGAYFGPEREAELMSQMRLKERSMMKTRILLWSLTFTLITLSLLAIAPALADPVSVDVKWDPVTTYADGTPLAPDLKFHYTLHICEQPITPTGACDTSISRFDLPSGQTHYRVLYHPPDNPRSGTLYFRVTAGRETPSAFSNQAEYPYAAQTPAHPIGLGSLTIHPVKP